MRWHPDFWNTVETIDVVLVNYVIVFWFLTAGWHSSPLQYSLFSGHLVFGVPDSTRFLSVVDFLVVIGIHRRINSTYIQVTELFTLEIKAFPLPLHHP